MTDRYEALSFSSILAVEIPRMVFEGANAVEIESVLNRIVDDTSWVKEWAKTAEKCERLAVSAEANGHRVTCRTMYLYASTYYRLAQFHIYADSSEKKDILQKCISCYRKAAALFDPPIIAVKIPFQQTTIPGYLHIPADTANPGCVICVPGIGICKEEFHNWCRHGVERGLAALVLDAPGNGETRAMQGLKLSIEAFDELLSSAVDYLQRLPEIAQDRIGIFGDCFGAYPACRAAALEKRFKACALIEGFYSSRDARMEDVPPLGLNLIKYICGEEYAQRFQTVGMPLEGIEERITCPLYIVHAREDSWIDISLAQNIYDMAEGPKQFEIIEERKVFRDYNFMRYNPVLDQLWKVVPAMWDWLQLCLTPESRQIKP